MNQAQAEAHAAHVARRAKMASHAVAESPPPRPKLIALTAPCPAIVARPVAAPVPPWFSNRPDADAHVRAFRRLTIHGSPPITLIIAAAARARGVTVDEIMGSCKVAPIVQARQVAMFLARELSSKSTPEIGRRFGGRHHTTVMHACQKLGASKEQSTLDLIAATRADIAANFRSRSA